MCDACTAKEIRLKHGAPVVATFIVDRNLRPVSETEVITGGSDADSPAAGGGHRLVVCTQQQIKVLSFFGTQNNVLSLPFTNLSILLAVISCYLVWYF